MEYVSKHVKRGVEINILWNRLSSLLDAVVPRQVMDRLSASCILFLYSYEVYLHVRLPDRITPEPESNMVKRDKAVITQTRLTFEPRAMTSCVRGQPAPTGR